MPFTLTGSFSPHPAACNLASNVVKHKSSRQLRSSKRLEKHGTNSFPFGGSFLFTKGGFSNAALDCRREMERNTVMVLPGAI